MVLISINSLIKSSDKLNSHDTMKISLIISIIIMMQLSKPWTLLKLLLILINGSLKYLSEISAYIVIRLYCWNINKKKYWISNITLLTIIVINRIVLIILMIIFSIIQASNILPAMIVRSLFAIVISLIISPGIKTI